MTSLKTCKLCKNKNEKLILGHVYSSLLLKYLATHEDGKVHLRLSDIPNRPLQDGPKKYMYCPCCDNEILSNIEKKFFNNVFKPLYETVSSINEIDEFSKENNILLKKFGAIALLNGIITSLTDAGIPGTESKGNLPINDYKKSIYKAVKNLRSLILHNTTVTNFDIYVGLYKDYISIDTQEDIFNNIDYVNQCHSMFMGFSSLSHLNHCIFLISIGRFSFYIFLNKECVPETPSNEVMKELINSNEYYSCKLSDSISKNMSENQKEKIKNKYHPDCYLENLTHLKNKH